MTPGDAASALSLGELEQRLRAPFGLEDANAPPVLVCSIDNAATAAIDTAAVGHLLGSVRAVTIGVVGEPLARHGAELAARFDILVAPPDIAGETMVPSTDPHRAVLDVAAGTTRNPHAAVALAELLRMHAYASVPQGLVAESLAYSMLQSGPEFAAWLHARGPAELPPDPAPPVLVERAATSLHITLNRPHRANAFTASVRDHLVEALRVAASDPTIEGVVLRGSGASFSSGGDLAEFGSSPDPATGYATRLLRSPAWWVDHLARDVRVHLHGACVGAGVEVPAFAGTVIAAPDTRIRLPEIAMGLVPGAGGTVSIPRRIGPHRTAYLAITGATLDADQALAWGLVDRIE